MKFMKLGSRPNAFQTNSDNSRYVTTELASDITVNAGGIKFYLHKFPLLSKSARLHKFVASACGENREEIEILDIPGGATAFEICAKFCYGITVTLNCYNVIAVRCAAEFLEMHESIEKGNLIYKIEVFLNSSIFRSWKDSIIVLQTTKSLLPWTEELKVINRCIDSIASKACIETSKVDWSYTYNRKKLSSENGLDQNWNGVRKQQLVPKDWWVEDLCELDLDYYKRVILAIKAKEKMPCSVVGESLKAYTYRRLPGFSKGNTSHSGDSMKYRAFVQTIIWLLPAETCVVSCSFLLRMLKTAIALNCSESETKELIKRIGRQLEEASVSDLLIPSTVDEDLMYDVDIVISMVEEFDVQEHGDVNLDIQDTDEVLEARSPSSVARFSKVTVAKLIDGYLAEIARDPNLPLSKFINLAKMVSGISRPLHDGLYHAIDRYLKNHTGLEKSEKKKLCSLMNCRKLSVEASTHAVQNERLPMRVVVQILFFQQMRAASAAGVTQLPPRENGGSHGSSRSAATTTTDEDWDGAPTVNDVKSLKSMALIGGSERSRGSSINKICNDDKVQSNKLKGLATPKKIINRLWSGKGHSRENSSSDTSESPGSVIMEETKSTTSRKSSQRI